MNKHADTHTVLIIGTLSSRLIVSTHVHLSKKKNPTLPLPRDVTRGRITDLFVSERAGLVEFVHKRGLLWYNWLRIIDYTDKLLRAPHGSATRVNRTLDRAAKMIHSSSVRAESLVLQTGMDS